MEIPLLKDFVIILTLSLLAIYSCQRLRIPTVVAFLVTGIVSGPQALGLISAPDEVAILAEIGIVVLLFSVGIELSIKKIVEYKRYFFLGGPIQVALTTICGASVAQILGRPFGESIFLGFLLSLSSTAIVLRILQEKGQTNTPHGHIALGLLIFQDFIVVPMMLVVPMLVGKGMEFNITFLYLFGKGLLILLITLFSAIKLVPKLLHLVAKTRSHEMFLLTLVALCFSVAWITSSVGLSLALGAFLAGLMISESEYRYQAIGDILPFRDLFSSFFFVSIGMLVDIHFFTTHFPLIFLITLSILVMKCCIVVFTALFLGGSLRSAVLSGFAVSQVGEFSFVLALGGMSHAIGTDYHYQLFLAFAVLSMGITPLLMAISPWFVRHLERFTWLERLFIRNEPMGIGKEKTIQDHVIIIGYGLCGRNLARSSKEADISYLIVDMNPEIVKQNRSLGESIYYGDATHEHILQQVHIETARVVAVLVNDPMACLRIVEVARELNPAVYIIARTHYVEEMAPLFTLGVNDVIPDELGSSVEIFTRVLERYDVSSSRVEELVTTLRLEGYENLRLRFAEKTYSSDFKTYLEGVIVKMVSIKEGSPLEGKSVGECELHRRYGVTVLAIKRGEETFYTIDSSARLYVGDTVGIIGTKEEIEVVSALFHSDLG